MHSTRADRARRRAARNPIVPHPRYGSASIASGLSILEQEIRDGFWRYGLDRIFPDSALLADASKQNYSVFPRKYYVDVLRKCRGCGRPFIFFAREQRYWFETLRFFVDADCVHCTACRRDSQALRRRLRRYSDLVGKKSPGREELMSLVDDGAYLLAHGVLRKLDRLGQLMNQARKRIPEYPGTTRLADAIASARQRQRGA